MHKTLRAQKLISTSGFSLIELAITLMIIGFVSTGAVQFYKHFERQKADIITKQRMDVLVKSFSVYVQQRWRLPCPASPNVAAGTTFGTEIQPIANCLTPAGSQGIIPYRTLGIPEQYAKDGYGNFFTYVVTPAFVENNVITGTNQDEIQRRQAYAIDLNNIASLPRAAFCGAADDVQGTDVNVGQDVQVAQDAASMFELRDQGGNPLARAENFVTQSYNAPVHANFFRDDVVTAPAMALISHGPNGVGAFLSNNTGTQSAGLPSGADEAATANRNRIVQLQGELSDTGAAGTNYDDVVQFYTQDQIMAAAGGGSCEHL